MTEKSQYNVCNKRQKEPLEALTASKNLINATDGSWSIVNECLLHVTGKVD